MPLANTPVWGVFKCWIRVAVYEGPHGGYAFLPRWRSLLGRRGQFAAGMQPRVLSGATRYSRVPCTPSGVLTPTAMSARAAAKTRIRSKLLWGLLPLAGGSRGLEASGIDSDDAGCGPGAVQARRSCFFCKRLVQNSDSSNRQHWSVLTPISDGPASVHLPR